MLNKECSINPYRLAVLASEEHPVYSQCLAAHNSSIGASCAIQEAPMEPYFASVYSINRKPRWGWAK